MGYATHWWRAATHVHLTVDEMCVVVEASDADESQDQSSFDLLLSPAKMSLRNSIDCGSEMA